MEVQKLKEFFQIKMENKLREKDILMKETAMTLEEAQEYFEFNTLNAYMGEHTPKYIKIYNK